MKEKAGGGLAVPAAPLEFADVFADEEGHVCFRHLGGGLVVVVVLVLVMMVVVVVMMMMMMMMMIMITSMMMMMMMTRYDDDKSIASTLGSKTHLCICSLRLLLASVAVAHTVPVACVIECKKTWCIGARRSINVTIMQCINDDNNAVH